MNTYQIRRAAKFFPDGLNLSLHGRMSTLALALALHCPGLLAEEMKGDPDAASLNAISAAQAEIPWMSGGVGEEAQAAMRGAAASYNVHIVFSSRDGAYLASIPFTVTRAGGQVVLTGITAGPLLNLKLEPGTYKIAAEIDDVRQTRPLRVGNGQGATKLNFIGSK